MIITLSSLSVGCRCSPYAGAGWIAWDLQDTAVYPYVFLCLFELAFPAQPLRTAIKSTECRVRVCTRYMHQGVWPHHGRGISDSQLAPSLSIAACSMPDASIFAQDGRLSEIVFSPFSRREEYEAK